jgi:RNA polymerase sigma factor (sigma-70 family)
MMSDPQTEQSDLLRSNASSPSGCSESREQLAVEIRQIVVECLAGQIPVKLQRVFSLDDLAQETSVRITSRVDTQPATVEVTRAYVLAVARRGLIDQLRHYLARKRSPEGGFINVCPTSSMNLLDQISQNTQTPSQINLKTEFWQEFRDKVDSLLNPQERELIDLHYDEGLTHEEIGRLLDRTVRAVHSALYRIRQKLKGELSKCPEYESYL